MSFKQRFRNFSGYVYALWKIISLRLYLSESRKRSEQGVTCIYFHNPLRKRLEKLICWLRRRKFRFISENELIEFLDGRIDIKGGVLLTFDDGWKGNLSIMPILEKYSIPVTLFLATDAIFNKGFFWGRLYEKQNKKRVGPEFHRLSYDNKLNLISSLSVGNRTDKQRDALTVQDLISLSNNPLVSFGLHTHHHVSLLNCTDDEIEKELEQNINGINFFYSGSVKSFAYPHGITDRNHKEAFRRKNIQFAMVTGNRTITKDADPFMLPRYGFKDASLLENYCRFMDCWRKKKT